MTSSGAGTMAGTHGSLHPVLSADRRARRRGDLSLLAPLPLAHGGPARGPPAGARRSHRRTDQGRSGSSWSASAGCSRTSVPGWLTPSCSGASSSCWRRPATTSPTGLVETILGWPFGGFLWSVVTFIANVFVGLVLASVIYYVIRRTVVRPTRLALTRDAFIILGLIFFIVLTELIGDAFVYVLEPDHPARPWAILAGPLSLAAGAARHRGGADRLRDHGLGAHRPRPRLRRVPAVQQAPPHHQQRAERLLPQPRAARRAPQDGSRSGGRARRARAGVRREGPQGPDLAAPPRSAGLHRVRPVHGVLPGELHRQDAEPEAPHGGPARPDLGSRDRAGGGRIGAARVEGGSQRRSRGLAR